MGLDVRSTSSQDCVLGNIQPSLTGLDGLPTFTQDCVLGYIQPSLTGT